MIALEQKAHFETFGFLFMRQALSADEMRDITQEADELLEADRRGSPRGQEAQVVAPFVERRALLSWLVEDDRIYETIAGLLGPGFIWAGSEGNVTVRSEHRWHADRPGEQEVGYTRVKVMLYLDRVTKESGCLRVIPGSHRQPLHIDLSLLSANQGDPGFMPFGVAGPDMPGYPLESEPGDIVFFNQSLYHAIFNGWAGRRYIALKFAAKPTADENLASLLRYSETIFQPDDAFVNSDRPRIRDMVAPLLKLGSNV